jgi:pimeloyl-ACP methyl ester carboxylesterase
VAQARVMATSAGPVEYVDIAGSGPAVLFFPGGHCTAASDCGWDLYTGSGRRLVSFSRPGYGRTRVGSLHAAEFVPAVAQCCAQLGIEQVAAVVGVSFGGMQAIHAACSLPMPVPGLVLHSCAPSSLRYPDTATQAWGAPLAFGPFTQRLTWAAIARSIRSEPGLKRMVATLSTCPVDDWWSTWSEDDQRQARALFLTMSSGTGFTLDLRQARDDRGPYRRAMQQQVGCPTLVTASRHDGGVVFHHAQDLAATISGALLRELTTPSHLFWLGPEASQARDAVTGFLAGVTP